MLTAFSEHYCWAVILFDQPTGYNTHNTFMPVFMDIQQYDFLFCNHSLSSIIANASSVMVLSASFLIAVITVQHFCIFVAPSWILFNKHLHRFFCIIHSACSIYPRCDHKYHIVNGNFL